MEFEFILSNTKKQKQMLNANDRPHWTQKAKITAYLRATAAKEGQKRVKGIIVPLIQKSALVGS